MYVRYVEEAYLNHKKLWVVSTFSIYLHYFQRKLKYLHTWPFSEGPKFWYNTFSVPPLIEGLKLQLFSRSFKNNSAILFYFFMKSFYVARFYPDFATDIKSFSVSALVTMETRLKVRILPLFVEIWHIYTCSFYQKLLA